MKPVCILGCGPSGLLAAHAAAVKQVPFTIISDVRKSKLGGAQYLHRPIPGLTDEEPEGEISYWTWGDGQTYREKVYGESDNVDFVSFDKVPSRAPAWSLKKVYDILWDSYSGLINQEWVGPDFIRHQAHEFSLVINAVPLPAICDARSPKEDRRAIHTFSSQEVIIHNRSIIQLPENTIVYAGTHDYSWYRCSQIFGTGSTEWSSNGKTPPFPDLVRASKPIWNNCDCWPNVIPVGRVGRWEKGILSHDGFFRTKEALDDLVQ